MEPKPPRPNLWFDVTTIREWDGTPLTGIQRAVVYVLIELLKGGAPIRCYAFDARAVAFDEIAVETLPAWFQRVRAGSAFTGAAPPQPRRRPLQRLAGVLPPVLAAGVEEFRLGLRSLRRAIKAWLRPKPTISDDAPLVRPTVTRAPFGQADTVIDLGASWREPFPVAAIAAIKRDRGLRYVGLVFDMIPVKFPHWIPAELGRRIRRFMRWQLTTVDHLLAISAATRHDVIDHCRTIGMPAPEITVIRLGDNVELERRRADESSRPSPRLVPRRPFVLCVSTVDVRKNHEGLYRAWRVLRAKLGESCPDLVLIGRRHFFVDDLMAQLRGDAGVRDIIHIIEDADDGELLWYYENCRFTIYPSFYEGWGVPIGESLALGRYCIASNTSAMPEVGGDLVDYFAPHDTQACIDLIVRAVMDPAYVRAREDEIRARYRITTWADTARQVLAIAGLAS